MKPIILKVGNNDVVSTNIKYDDLIILYQQYINTYNEVPIMSKCDGKHNMPQFRIIKKILHENNITYNDFVNMFGKVSHVRTESNDYNLYLSKYKEISKGIGHSLTRNDLVCNNYGLPSGSWFVKYCPDNNVKTFDDFVIWCGFNSNVYKNDKEQVCQKLIELQNKLGRPIINKDINKENIGFSMIVINRLFGDLGKAKKELGLLKTLPVQPKSFEYYKKILTDTLNNINKKTGRNFVSWRDIESGIYSSESCNHKAILSAFKREGIDIYAYIKSIGFTMNQSSFSYKYTFDDGERTLSSLEFDFSKFIRSNGYKYNENYYRDVRYSNFTNCSNKSKINCDYCIDINGKKLYVEIAGIIYNTNCNSWRNHSYSSKRENDYRDNMIKKEKYLIDSKVNYLFIFLNDMQDNSYQDKLLKCIKEIKLQSQ